LLPDGNNLLGQLLASGGPKETKEH
jgi:hypothetical protein